VPVRNWSGIAFELAKEGANVVVSDIDMSGCETVVKEIESLGAKGLAVKCDVSKKIEVDQMVKAAVDKFGSLDILVNNAGVYPLSRFWS